MKKSKISNESIKNNEFTDELTMMMVSQLVNCKSFSTQEKLNLLKILFNEKSRF